MTVPLNTFIGLYELAKKRPPYQPTSSWGPGTYKPDELLKSTKEFIADELLHPKNGRCEWIRTTDLLRMKEMH